MRDHPASVNEAVSAKKRQAGFSSTHGCDKKAAPEICVTVYVSEGKIWRRQFEMRQNKFVSLEVKTKI